VATPFLAFALLKGEGNDSLPLGRGELEKGCPQEGLNLCNLKV